MAAHLDGNVLAGPLSEIFLADMTMADACCGGCADVSVIARSIVEITGDTFVIRCHLCGHTLGILLQSPDANRLDTSGMSWLGVPRVL
jgi:hypothetical protein